MNCHERADSIRTLAKQQWHKEGEIELDDYPDISEGDDNGAYVQAWVWVSFANTALDKETDDE